MTEALVTRVALDRLLHPRSVAIVGVSPDATSTGGACLGNLERFGYGGDIHLVSRSRAEVNGRACAPTIDELPPGIDAAILALPQAGIVEALEACARRTIGAAVVFASGFAEAGDDGRAQQARLTAIARDAGMALAGPNCLGLVNYANGIPFLMTRAEPRPPSNATTISVLAQSGGMMMTLNNFFHARGIAVAFAVSTGNEAVTTVEDYLGALLDEPVGGPIVLFVECLRQPQRLLESARLARERGRPIVMLHTGRSVGARESARSHTGALAGDYAVMRAFAEHAGIVFVESLDALLDAAAMIARFPQGAAGGLGIITESGAYKGHAIDVCEQLGITLADLSPATTETIAQAMPAYATVDNPLDLTAHAIRDANLYAVAARAFVADPGIGAIVAPVMTGPTSLGKLAESGMIETLLSSDKPSTLAFIGADEPPPAIAAAARAAGYPLFTSGERALRAIDYVMRLRPPSPPSAVVVDEPSPALALALAQAAGQSTLTECAAKALFAAAGIPIPRGRLATTIAEAVDIAREIGYPVVLKAQSVALLHKTEAGAVLLDLRDEAALRAAWAAIAAALAARRPDARIDGMLVEAMAPRGIELVVGAKRDPDWGTVLVMGLGGIWIETLGDVALLPATASPAEIVGALDRLAGAPLLKGARGAAAVNRVAVADVVMRLARVMRAMPHVREMEINPLLAHDGRVVALDALVSG